MVIGDRRPGSGGPSILAPRRHSAPETVAVRTIRPAGRGTVHSFLGGPRTFSEPAVFPRTNRGDPGWSEHRRRAGVIGTPRGEFYAPVHDLLHDVGLDARAARSYRSVPPAVRLGGSLPRGPHRSDARGDGGHSSGPGHRELRLAVTPDCSPADAKPLGDLPPDEPPPDRLLDLGRVLGDGGEVSDPPVEVVEPADPSTLYDRSNSRLTS